MSKDCSTESLLDMACGNLPLTTYAKLKPPFKVAFDLNAQCIRNAKKKSLVIIILLQALKRYLSRMKVSISSFPGEMIEHLKNLKYFY